MRKTHVVIHCSATPDLGTLSWGAIRRYHVEQRGWRDIGYHIGIERVGEAYEVMLGRPIDVDGAHCRHANMNRVSLGVCFVGEYDNEPPPQEMLQVAARHLKPLLAALDIPADNEHIHPHSEFHSGKTCPGLEFSVASLIALMR